MDTTSWFWVSFLLTLALLVAALVTGWGGWRRVHLRLGPIALLSLAVTVVMAERLGKARVFPEEEMVIHLWFAKSAALLAVLVGGTGIYLWRTGRGRLVHRVCVLLFLLLTLIATGTGVWAFGMSTPI